MKIKKYNNFSNVEDRLEDEIKALSYILEDHGTKVDIIFGEVEDTEIIDHRIVIDIESERYQDTHAITLWKEICRLKDPIIEYVDRLVGIIGNEKVKSIISINLNGRVWMLEIRSGDSVQVMDVCQGMFIDIEDWSPEDNMNSAIKREESHKRRTRR